MPLTITKVTKTTEEVVSFLNPQFVEKEMPNHPLMDLTFVTRVDMNEKLEEFFKGAMVTTTSWSDRSVRYILPDYRSEKKCIYFDFFTDPS